MLSTAAYAALSKRQPKAYWLYVRICARRLKSDGCSGPARMTQWYKDACLEHDCHYRLGETVSGLPISREQADDLFAARIRQMAWDGLSWSPSSWKHLGGVVVSAWRWAAVRVGGSAAYKGAK
jgi:hypothetical protein